MTSANIIPDGYSLEEFTAGYNRRNSKPLHRLTFSEVRALAVKYEDIDPFISAVVQAAYAKARAARMTC